MTRTMSLTLAGLIALAAIAGAAQPAAANPVSDALSDDDEDDSLIPSVDAVIAAAQGITDRVTDATNRDETAAEDAAADMTDAFNAENETIRKYANDRTTADTDYDVFEISFEVDDEDAVRYLVTDANESSGDYESAEMVDSDEFEAMDREVDETVTLRESAARNADDEVEFFVDEYAGEDRDVDDAYLSRLGTRYGSLWGDDLVETSFDI